MCEHHDVTVGDCGLDETLTSIRDEMRKFSDSEVMPQAHEWHLSNSFIPLEIIAQMAELGVFGLDDPGSLSAAWGSARRRMCVVAEELVARLYRRRLARHPLRDRGRTDPRQRHRGAEAQVAAEDRVGRGAADGGVHRARIPAPTSPRSRRARCATAMSTRSTATRPGSRIAVRADLMMLLVRTNPKEPGYRGLSMLLAEKPRGTDENPFPVAGMSGTEIGVLGYRGMKEYEIAFDGFEVPAARPARRRRGAGLQAADGDVRIVAHPDCGARGRGGAGGDGGGATLCASAPAVRRADRRRSRASPTSSR